MKLRSCAISRPDWNRCARRRLAFDSSSGQEKGFDPLRPPRRGLGSSRRTAVSVRFDSRRRKSRRQPETWGGVESRLEETANSVYNVGSRQFAGVAKHGMNPPQPKPRRFTVIASGLLCGALAMVVLYTRRAAFFSPLAIIVVAAIGSAAVLLQLRVRNRERGQALRPPTWLNLMGIVFAVIALFADRLGLNLQVTQLLALGAVGSFAVSSAVVLHAFRKDKATEVSK
jgi:hypothetical protein